MKRPVRLALVAAGAALALVAGLAAVAVNLDPGIFKERISKSVKATTGLDVEFHGPIEAHYFPTLGVRLSRVKVLSPTGGDNLADLERADVSVGLMALLSGRVEAGKAVIEGLDVHLVRDEQGRLNLPVPPVKEVRIEQDKVVVVTTAEERYVLDYQIEGVSISRSRFTFDDRQAGAKTVLWDFSLESGRIVRGKPFDVRMGFGYALDRPEVSGRFDLSGKGAAELETMRFSFTDASVATSAAGKGLPVKDLQARWTGAVRADVEAGRYSGDKLNISATGRGGVLPAEGAGFTLTMDAAHDAKAQTAELTALSLDVMGFVLSGEVHAAGLAKAPVVKASFSTNEFNPRQVLEKFGVTIKDAGTAKASFALDADMAKGTAGLTRVAVRALGVDLTGEAFAENFPADPRVRGALALAECNPRQVLAALGQPLPPSSKPQALSRLKAALSFEGTGNEFTLRTTDFKLDESTLSLKAGIKNAPSGKPRVDFALKADSLDVDGYLPPSGNGKGGDEAKGKAMPRPGIAADVSGAVEVGRLVVSKLHLQNVSARLGVKENMLDVGPATASLYQGSLKAGLRTDVRGGPGAPLSLNASVDGVQVEPLLKDLTGKAAIKGRAGFTSNVTARGQEADDVLRTLAGKASLVLRDGSIPGVILSPDLLSAPDKLLTGREGQGGTPIESVTASFAISQGVARNSDLNASIPPHRATGHDSINLPARTLDYTLDVHFARLARIPVYVSGPLDSPRVVPDANALAAALARGVIENIPKDPRHLTPENLGKGALDALGNMLGGQKKK